MNYEEAFVDELDKIASKGLPGKVPDKVTEQIREIYKRWRASRRRFLEPGVPGRVSGGVGYAERYSKSTKKIKQP